MSFDSPASLVLMPPEDDQRRSELIDLSFELAQAAARLGSSLHPVVKAEAGRLVRAMNCYYSNLIEGHNTLPRDIERAMENDFSSEPAQRDLQLEARAHIQVQTLIDEGALDGIGFGREFVRRLHLEFCGRLPGDLLLVEDPLTKERIRVVPGEWRSREVVVGKHRPIDASMVDSFMLRFEEGYDLKRIGKSLRAIAAAASHHRLLWIHPFMDGNGRVARLHSHAYLRGAEIGSELWSVSRGFAKTVKDYRMLLERADWPPQGGRDGRGTLSDGSLADFIRYFLNTAKDQVDFMHGLLEPSSLLERIRGFVAKEAEAKRLDARVGAVLERLIVAGVVEKGDLPRLLGVEGRQARRLLEPLAKRRLIVADSVHGPLRISFPSSEMDDIFPKLFSPVAEPTSTITPK